MRLAQETSLAQTLALRLESLSNSSPSADYATGYQFNRLQRQRKAGVSSLLVLDTGIILRRRF